MATDSRSIAIAAAVTGSTFYNPLRANAFAEELLSHERTLLPATAQNTSRLDQIRQLNANKPFLNQLAKAWDKDPAILDKLSSQLSANPALLARFRASMTADGQDGNLNTTSGKLTQYIANPTAATLNRLYPAPAAAPAAAARPTPRSAPAAESTPARPRAAAPARERTESVAPRVETPRPAAQAATTQPEVSPIQATAGATSSRLTADDAKTLVQTLGTQAADMYRQADGKSEMDARLATLNARLNDPQSGRAYAQELANTFNSDPELLRQLTSTGEGGMDNLFKKYEEQTPQVQDGIRRGLKNGIEQFLDDPKRLANKQFRDDLASTAQSSGTTAGINSFFQGIFGEGFDLGGIWDSIKSFCQPLIDMCKDLFAGFSANGGISNVLSMGNGEGLLGGMSQALQDGNRIRSQEALIENDQSVRAVDRNRDGKFDDADKKEVNGKRVFELQGMSNENWTIYAERVNPTTGQMLPGSTYSVRNGEVTRTNDNDKPANPVTPPAPNQQMQTLGAKGPEPAGGNLTPNMSTLGIGS